MTLKVEINDKSTFSDAVSRVFVKAAEGISYKAIANDLDLSEETVKTHLKVAREELHATKLLQAVSTAVARGIITIKEVGGSSLFAIFLTASSSFAFGEDDKTDLVRTKTPQVRTTLVRGRNDA